MEISLVLKEEEFLGQVNIKRIQSTVLISKKLFWIFLQFGREFAFFAKQLLFFHVLFQGMASLFYFETSRSHIGDLFWGTRRTKLNLKVSKEFHIPHAFKRLFTRDEVWCFWGKILMLKRDFPYEYWRYELLFFGKPELVTWVCLWKLAHFKKLSCQFSSWPKFLWKKRVCSVRSQDPSFSKQESDRVIQW